MRLVDSILKIGEADNKDNISSLEFKSFSLPTKLVAMNYVFKNKFLDGSDKLVNKVIGGEKDITAFLFSLFSENKIKKGVSIVVQINPIREDGIPQSGTKFFVKIENGKLLMAKFNSTIFSMDSKNATYLPETSRVE